MSDSLIQEGGGGSIIIRGGKFYAENTQFRIDASEDNNSLIDIDAENISMINSRMNTMPATTGKGGDILLNAAESVSFSETHLYTYTEGGMKNAGNVHIGADNISVGKSFINTFTSGMGNGGEILFDARNSVLCSDSNMNADTQSKAQAAGNAGNIRIKAGNISVKRFDSEQFYEQCGQRRKYHPRCRTIGAIVKICDKFFG
ncbi:MAG: hypothetical protein HC887_10995 [Desulfobacteraceae bacterium]|nr:hypothetical protein [Desulfobacteraceae bacterium]